MPDCRDHTDKAVAWDKVAEKNAEIAWLRSSLVSVMTFCNSERPPSYAALAEVARRGLEVPSKAHGLR